MCTSVIELQYVYLAVTLFCTGECIRVKREPGTGTFGFPYDQMVLFIVHGQICSLSANARAQSAYWLLESRAVYRTGQGAS